MFEKNISKSDLAIISLLSIGLTIPFIYYARDLAKSLRIIAGHQSGQQRPLYNKRYLQRTR